MDNRAAAQVTETRRSHVAVLSFPFASHPSSLLTLLRSVSAKSRQTTAFSFFSTEKVNKTLFPTRPDPNLPNTTPYDVHNGLPEGFQARPGPPMEEVGLFMKSAPENFRAAIEASEEAVGCKVSCLVTEAFLWFAADMAAEMGVPWVPVYCGGPLSLIASVQTDLIRHTVGLTTDSAAGGFEDKTLDSIPGFSTVRCADLPEQTLQSLDSPFASMVHKMGQNLPKASYVVMNNFFEEANPIPTQYLRTKLRALLAIGTPALTITPHHDDDYGCIPWLDQQQPRSVVYLSFGTMVTPPPPELQSLAEALKETGYPFLWSFRGDVEKHFSRDFLDGNGGKFVKWAPQVEILAHASVGVYVTHFGWNSVVESINRGVPMIGRPFFGDHPINGRAVESVWKIGLGMERFTKGEVVRALTMVMAEDQGKRMRERVHLLKQLALRSAAPNGSCTRDFHYLVDILNN